MKQSLKNSPNKMDDDDDALSTVSIDLISNDGDNSNLLDASVEYDEPANSNVDSSNDNPLVDAEPANSNVVSSNDNPLVHAQFAVINDQNTQTNNTNTQSEVASVDVNNNITTASNPTLLKINQLNTDVNIPWRVRAIVQFKHPTKSFVNTNGIGEVTLWDLVDDSGSVNLIAYNMHSNILNISINVGRCYEFSNLNIRTVDELYKTLANNFQLVARTNTIFRQVEPDFVHQSITNFVNLRDIEQLPLNSIIDIDVRVLRDYGIATGFSNGNSWTRRELHVVQDGFQTRITLWNDIAKQSANSMVNQNVQFINVKIGWFNGTRNLLTMANSRLLMSSI